MGARDTDMPVVVNRHVPIYLHRLAGRVVVMTIGERIEQRRKDVGIASQAELARRASVPQQTMNGLINRPYNWSPHLPRLARELRTTLAFLLGHSDDPDADLPPPADLDHDQRQLVDAFDHLGDEDRAALLRIAQSMADKGKPPTIHSPRIAYAAEAAGDR
jgi:transcriptional regulator with XRE-family HTH domain